MTLLRAAAIQMRSGADPAANAAAATALVREAAADGARYVQTPELTNLVQRSKRRAAEVIATEADDATLAALRNVAAGAGITVHIGSLILREGTRWVNRAFVIDGAGAITARYDKIHMFDVDLPNGERFRESSAYIAGGEAVIATVEGAHIGLAICFDIRFPALYSALAEAGATVLTAPAAFAVPTGKAHWHVLARARAIENGAFMIAAAQEGKHEDGRATYGHALIVDPWGRILCEADTTPSVIVADLDLSAAEAARRQIPVLSARKPFAVPQGAKPPLQPIGVP